MNPATQSNDPVPPQPATGKSETEPTPAQEGGMWRVPLTAMWVLVLFIGLFSAEVYQLLRITGRVNALRALVNDDFLVTAGLAIMVGTFAARQAQRFLDEGHEAKDRGLSLGLISLFAFVPVSATVFWGQLSGNEILLAFFALKLIAFSYLLTLFLRFFLFGEEDVFARAFNLFHLSAVEKAPPQEEEPAEDAEASPLPESSSDYLKDTQPPR